MSTSPHALTIEESVNLKIVGDAQISPDGSLVAFTVNDTFKLETRRPKSQIWLAHSDGSGAQVLTTGPRVDTQPRWSPDGVLLAFLSDRVEDGKFQIHLLARNGGEAQQLTYVDGEIIDFQWSHDGKRIAFLMHDAETEEEKRQREEKDDTIEFEQHPRFARVWIFDIVTCQIHQVTQGDIHVWEYEWSPNDRDFVLLASDAPFEYEWYRPRLARVLAKGGKPQTIYTPSGNKQLALPRWSPDGKQIAFISCIWSDRGVVSGDLQVMKVNGSRVRNLTVNTPRDYSDFVWMPDGRGLIVMGYESGDAMIGRVDVATGVYRQLWRGDAAFMGRHWQRFTLSSNQKVLAAVREDATNPPDVWIARLSRNAVEWKQLSKINPQTADFRIGATEKIFWHSSDGKEMQGFIIKPLGYKPGKRYPMVTWVHGGPAGIYGARYYASSSRFQLLATNGFLVFLPNPRGSLGWGTAFTESNVGDMGGMDWHDIMIGIDHCIAQGWADEKRLGLAGWSYGGFMTAWGITQTNRFKAALMGAAITNWLSFHGTSNLCTWDAIANNASPYEHSAAYDKFSPMNFIANVETPTLVLHGAVDPYVPVGQGYEYYRALKDLGVETQIVVYPRESHGFQERNHLIDLNRRVVEWFKRYL